MIETKDYKDYIEELEDYFPQLQAGELDKIVAPTISKLVTFLKRGRRGYSVCAGFSAFSDKQGTFTVGNIYGKKHLRHVKKFKKYFKNIEENGKKEQKDSGDRSRGRGK